jgi:hypothetical protein
MVRDFGISHAEAIRRLNFQGAADEILDEISDILGERDGDQWFDHDDRGRLKVGIARRDGGIEGPELDRVRRLVAARHLSDDVDFVAVDHSFRELVDAQEKIVSARVDDLLRAGKVTHGIDPSENAIVILVASSTTADERRRLRAIADRAPVRVVIRETDSPTLFATLESRRRAPRRATTMQGRWNSASA